jgi:UDP-N-acetylmuramoylalanine--D-glutamate ligase
MSASSAATGIERLRVSKVAVWGAGVEGIEVAKAALSRGAEVVLVDDWLGEANSVSVDGVEVPLLAPDALLEGHFDCVVRSPGVPVYRDELQKLMAAGSVVTTATAMWLEDFSDRRVIGVTGTKGKTTTAWFTALALEALGLDVRLGGNMGTPLTALYDEKPSDVYVVEVSSFQGADVRVSPPVGVLTLLAPDHLDWHGSYERYVHDKLNLFDHRPDVALAVASSSADAVDRTAGYERRVLYGGAGRLTVGPRGVMLDGSRFLDVDTSTRLWRGEHNRVNLCGALTACMLEEDDLPSSESLEQALGKMPVLPSRLQSVGTCGGIEFVNDALASNPAGTIAALRTFEGRPICLIVGGQDRGVDLDPLVRALNDLSPPPRVVSLPGLGDRLSGELTASGYPISCVAAPGVHEAVQLARTLIGAQGVVLFSPAAPTPRVEGTYVQRGKAFNEAVAEIGASDP